MILHLLEEDVLEVIYIQEVRTSDSEENEKTQKVKTQLKNIDF